MDSFRLANGARVTIPRAAEIEPSFLPGGALEHVTQEVLSQVNIWRGRLKSDCIRNATLVDPVAPIVIPNRGARPFFGIYAYHTARNPQVSPFLLVDRPLKTYLFSVYLTGSASHPLLYRAHPGEVMPPLPWQSTAHGRENECAKFWRNHSFVCTHDRMPGRKRPAPVWYTHDPAPSLR